ncbi:MAG: hypothetical protein N3H30_01650 [Candidatus Micrarchaeota archaeon]|nr:hypothetical protein [Candidatus Micrarchaeota archaeon]
MKHVREVKREFAESIVNATLAAFSKRIPRERHEEIMRDLPKNSGWAMEQLGASSFAVTRPPLLSQHLDDIFLFIFTSALPHLPESARTEVSEEIAASISGGFMALNVGLHGESEPFVKRVRLELSAFVDYLMVVGFISDGHVHFTNLRSGPIDFPGFDHEEWRSRRTGRFLFEMRNPTFITTNQAIFEQFGYYPRISSYAVRQLLSKYLVKSEWEETYINPEGFTQDTVIELWKFSLE